MIYSVFLEILKKDFFQIIKEHHACSAFNSVILIPLIFQSSLNMVTVMQIQRKQILITIHRHVDIPVPRSQGLLQTLPPVD